MVGTIVNSDWWVSEQAAWSRAKQLAEGATLRLFSNNFTPTPASVVADFTEATFSSYNAVDLTGIWGAPTQVVAGDYLHVTSFAEFTSDDGTGQQIYGWYITNDTPRVIHSGLLPAPVLMVDPQVLRIRINYRDVAIVLL